MRKISVPRSRSNAPSHWFNLAPIHFTRFHQGDGGYGFVVFVGSLAKKLRVNFEGVAQVKGADAKDSVHGNFGVMGAVNSGDRIHSPNPLLQSHQLFLRDQINFV